VKDLLSSKECLHVGNKEQDPGVMQRRQLVMQFRIQHLNSNKDLKIGNKEQDPGVIQSWQLVMHFRIQHLQ
jgi:hypothetical protein